MTDEFVDDAVHVIAPSGRTTLCGQRLTGELTFVSLNDDPPDMWAGCWTCLAERDALEET